MSFAQRVSTVFRRQMSNLKVAHARRVQEAEARAQRRMAEAKTRNERARAKLALEREKLALKKELYEAQIATRGAKAAVKKARLEAGDLTVGERFSSIGRGLGKSARDAYKALEKQSRKPTRKRRVATKGGKKK